MTTPKQLERLERKKAERKQRALANKESRIKYEDCMLGVKNRDGWKCAICNKDYSNNKKGLQAAHILSKENYPELMLDPMNIISLCFYHHKNAQISSHLDGFVFTQWLRKHRPEQYNYLVLFLVRHDL